MMQVIPYKTKKRKTGAEARKAGLRRMRRSELRRSERMSLPDKAYVPVGCVLGRSTDVEYGYAYTCKPPYLVASIVAGGKLKTDRGMVIKHIVSSEITEYMGIIAKRIGTDYGNTYSLVLV